MITITLTKRLKNRKFKLTRVCAVGHADVGTEQRQFQVCAAASILTHALASRMGQLHKREHGRSDVRIPAHTSRKVVSYVVHGFEELQAIAPENVRLRTTWILPAPPGGFPARVRKAEAAARRRRKAAAALQGG